MHLTTSLFLHLCASSGLPQPELEFRFHPQRRWRLDFAWPPLRLALEVEGGAWLPGGGRHNRGRGFLADMTKYNAAVLLGWRILRVTPQQLKNGQALALVGEAMLAE